jgi:hypothetical protein
MASESAELRSERATLSRADLDIAEGEERVRHQAAIVVQLRDLGHDSLRAERLLETLHDTLDAWKVHRTLILERIAYLERRASGGRD